MIKVKRKIISVEPITPIANTRFKEEMDLLTSCYVEDENETQVFLCSVNKKYKFIMNKKEDKMDAIVALCKRRGFVFQGSEIYGGLAGNLHRD